MPNLSKLSTAERLAYDLRAIGLDDLAEKAEEYYYDEWRSQLVAPLLALYGDLMRAGTPKALAMAKRVQDGAYDGTDAEADAWANSDEGKEAFGSLLRGTRRSGPLD